jgi:2-oxo-4-hydroxy-4-carboxy-5-ureidoimidazoline decarboxylase
VTLAELNSGDRQGFIEAVGWVFEHSPWVAERAWSRRPFDTVESLHGAMVSEVASATPEERLALVRAHPDLGARAKMSDASSTEQARAGLDTLTRPELERLTALNAAYRDKFGFPFLFAVRRATRQDILNALEKRLLATRDVEFDEALRQVYRIARFRLEDLLS